MPSCPIIPFPANETNDMPRRCGAHASIQIAQHDDGRWMWGLSWWECWAGGGFAALPKWGKFAATRQAAIDSAVAELRSRNIGPHITKWLDDLDGERNLTLF